MSKQLSEKFFWMRGCIAHHFSLKEDVASVLFSHAGAFFSNQADRQKIQLPLNSQGSPRIFVYHQIPDTGSSNDHSAIDTQLFLTYGDTERIKDKAVLSLKTCPKTRKRYRKYQEAYKATKEKVADMPKGKTFDFSETQIFSKFDQFSKRLQRLI
jgi:hypothetical protein